MDMELSKLVHCVEGSRVVVRVKQKVMTIHCFCSFEGKNMFCCLLRRILHWRPK